MSSVNRYSEVIRIYAWFFLGLVPFVFLYLCFCNSDMLAGSPALRSVVVYAGALLSVAFSLSMFAYVCRFLWRCLKGMGGVGKDG